MFWGYDSLTTKTRSLCGRCSLHGTLFFPEALHVLLVLHELEITFSRSCSAMLLSLHVLLVHVAAYATTVDVYCCICY